MGGRTVLCVGDSIVRGVCGVLRIALRLATTWMVTSTPAADAVFATTLHRWWRRWVIDRSQQAPRLRATPRGPGFEQPIGGEGVVWGDGSSAGGAAADVSE
eukprot:gene49080-41516_t